MARKDTPNSSSQTQPIEYVKLRIELKDVKPKVWRGFIVRSDLTLKQFHLVLQQVMGWSNYHLHQFYDSHGNCYIDQTGERFDHAVDERKFYIRDFLIEPKSKMTYEYDFGDGWEHAITSSGIVEAPKGQPTAVCIDGARSCPAEDSGGPWGYQDKLNILRNPKHAEYEEVAEWIGEYFDSEHFSMDDVNEGLRQLRIRTHSKSKGKPK